MVQTVQVSKNQKPTSRGKGQKTRMLDGKEVKPTLFVGTFVGQGKFMAGTVNGDLVRNEKGKVLPLRSIGELV